MDRTAYLLRELLEHPDMTQRALADKMYLSLGFRYIGTVPILYEDIGESRDFRLYELVLSN